MKGYLKEKELITIEYVQLLKEHILANQDTFFTKENQADAWRDFITFSTPTDRKHLCMPNEPMLIDRSIHGRHVYAICTVSENGRVGLEIPVVAVEELDSGKWRNGYFLLPLLTPSP